MIHVSGHLFLHSSSCVLSVLCRFTSFFPLLKKKTFRIEKALSGLMILYMTVKIVEANTWCGAD